MDKLMCPDVMTALGKEDAAIYVIFGILYVAE